MKFKLPESKCLYTRYFLIFLSFSLKVNKQLRENVSHEHTHFYHNYIPVICREVIRICFYKFDLFCYGSHVEFYFLRNTF